MSPKQRYFFSCKCFFPPNPQEHTQILNYSAWGWPKNKNGFTFQKSDFPKASTAWFSRTFTLWELTTTWRCSLFGGEETRPQDVEFLQGPVYSLIAYPDLQHLNQGHKRPRLPGRLLAASDCIWGANIGIPALMHKHLFDIWLSELEILSTETKPDD